MSKSTCAWVNGPPVPDYSRLTMMELLALWHEQRNTPVGIMAADEVCRRVEEITGKTAKPPTR